MIDLPVIKNLFLNPAMQDYLAKQLAGKDVRLFQACYGLDDDGNKIWDWTHPENYSRFHGCAYYCMIGTAVGEWVFAPSMAMVPFKINGDWYTVETVEGESYYGPTIAYHLARLPNGDESEDLYERLAA